MTKRPTEKDARDLHKRALALGTSTAASLSNAAREQIATIAEHSEQLHHLDIDKARHEAFRPISHAVVTLASLVRDDTGQQPFYQNVLSDGERRWWRLVTTERPATQSLLG